MASEDDDLCRFDNICDIQETRDKAREIYRLVKSNPNVSGLGTVALAAICAYIASSRLRNGDVQRNLALTASSLATMADFEMGVSTVEYALGGGHQGRKSRSSTHGFYDRLIEEHRLTAMSGFLKRSMRKAEDFLVMQAVFDIDNREIKYAIFYWIHAILMPNVRLDHEALLEETGDTGKFDHIVQLLTSRAVHLKEQITAERSEHVSALPSSYPTPSKSPTRAQRATKPEKLPTHFDANKDMTPTRSLTLKIPRLSSDNSSSGSPVTRTSEAPVPVAPLQVLEDPQEDGYVDMLKIYGTSFTARDKLLYTLQTYLRGKMAGTRTSLKCPCLLNLDRILQLGSLLYSALKRDLEEKEATLTVANTNAENLQAELSSLEKRLKNKDSELAAATTTITTLQSEIQQQSFKYQQEFATLKNKLEDAQRSKETCQERQVSEAAVQPLVEMSGVEIANDQQIETDPTLQSSRSGQEEARHLSLRRHGSDVEELEDLDRLHRDSQQEDMFKDEIQRLRDDNSVITARYKRKIDALKRQITSERTTRQQQDILEYLSITAQSAHLSEAIEDYEPRSETSRRVLMAVRSHLKALDTIGQRRRKIPLKYDKLVEVVTNRYNIKEEEMEEIEGLNLWEVDEDEELEDAELEPRHKKRKVTSA
ncbi:uncharacterized protein EV420DRAFT_1515385 [Desarmillaria tabescens]|uniref:Uncharacterized protein n=1 Tax=Armillaria tabescens TaxID=1929756 RepID=A0AA39NEM6_ARMTA|nr:uncharacterized protein EV420DRAFT_1515385 [Desarmillaria tabescens]KAK0464214.1 hypothetical protein EV420DRAFT_1515385 [Desarmillaria tabescens]